MCPGAYVSCRELWAQTTALAAQLARMVHIRTENAALAQQHAQLRGQDTLSLRLVRLRGARRPIGERAGLPATEIDGLADWAMGVCHDQEPAASGQ
jgi:hypothetical protein